MYPFLKFLVTANFCFTHAFAKLYAMADATSWDTVLVKAAFQSQFY